MGEKKLFIELLQIALGTCNELSCVPTAAEWYALLKEAERQAVAGILLEGVQRLMVKDSWTSHAAKPSARFTENLSKEQMLQWIGEVMQIEQQNAVTTKACQELCEKLEKDGFKACVLKGQSNYRYYPKEMSNRRSCGDVDMWLVPSESLEFRVESLESVQKFKRSKSSKGATRQVLEYVDAHWERTGLCWLHCNFNHESGVPVEVHFHPSFFSRPWRNRRFQKFFGDIEKCVDRYELGGIEIPVMKAEMNLVYQMNHIYRHLIDEGVGLRQVIDYYYLLRYYNEHESPLIDKKETINRTIENLGMKRFAGALMFVLKELLGMPEEYLLCETSVVDGRFLMNEILMSGNFGHGDPRMGEITSKNYLSGRLSQAWRRFKRNLRFVTSYPGEVIWEPIVRVEHYVWKELKLWK